jgi:hypothetical protein
MEENNQSSSKIAMGIIKRLQKEVKGFYLLIVFLSSLLSAYAQEPQFDSASIIFKSLEDKKIYEAIAPKVERILQGLEPGPEITPEIIAQGLRLSFNDKARKYNYEKDSPEWKYHFERITQQKNFILAKRPSNNAPLKHLRFSGGKPYPSFQDLEAEVIRRAESRQERPRTVSRTKRSAIKLGNNVSKDLQELALIEKPKCTVSSAAELAIPEDFIAGSESVDLLFFDGQPPFDVKTAVGASTKLIIFGDKKFALEASAYESLPISCLPFRLRSDGKNVLYAQGVEAIKNFDASPGSKGTLDPTIRKYLEKEGFQND